MKKPLFLTLFLTLAFLVSYIPSLADEAIESEIKIIANVSSTSAATVGFTKSNVLKIYEITLETEANVSNVKIILIEGSKPPGAHEPILKNSGEIYKYIKITKTNITDKNISEVRIKFKVEKSWIDTNGINPYTVALNKWYIDKWDKLTTSKLKEDNSYFYYEAESSGLSIFSITGNFGEAICIPDEKRCSDDKLEKCSSEGIEWEIIETCEHGCNSTNLTCNLIPGCEPKPEVGNWSECTEGLQRRTNYYCNVSTGYEWVSYVETGECEVETEEAEARDLDLWIIGGIAGGLGTTLIIISGIIFWRRGEKFTEKKPKELTTHSLIKNGKKLRGKEIKIRGSLHPEEDGVYIIRDDSGTLWAYGPGNIQDGRYIIEGTLEKTERGWSIFIENVIPVST
jgi:PGF-pre-PGF domain-containing protein